MNGFVALPPLLLKAMILLETFRSLELHVHLPLFGAISSSPFRRWPVFHVASLSPLHTLRYVEMPERDKAWQRVKHVKHCFSMHVFNTALACINTVQQCFVAKY